MDTQMLVELIGYLGSALVVVSMLMTSVVRLRVINLIGSLIFTVYALIIRSYPTAAMNLFLVGINVFHLVRLLRIRPHYDMIRTDVRDSFFAYQLEVHMPDILQWFPAFSPEARQADVVCLVCCDGTLAGLFMAAHAGDGVLDLLLDYTTPAYRDTSVGRFLHAELARDGFRTIVFRDSAPRHVPYMEKMGYRKDGRGRYVLQLQQPEPGAGR